MPEWQVSKRALIFSALLFWGALFGCSTSVAESAALPCQRTQFDETAIVDKVYDGDTIRLRDSRIVRFIGINTPEMSRDFVPAQALAVEAKQALEGLIPPGSTVGIEYDQARQDHHKRTLAHVYSLSGQNLSAVLIERGQGFAIVVPPNTAWSKCYFASEKLARTYKRGIWSHPDYMAKPSSTLTKDDTGFQHVFGTITAIGPGKKNVWLDMGEGLSLRIQRQHLQYFANMPLEDLKGQQVRVRGWASFYNNKLRINIGHPAMMELVESQ